MARAYRRAPAKMATDKIKLSHLLALRRASSTNHRISYDSILGFRIHWSVVTKRKRLRVLIPMSKSTTANGAIQFAKRWGCTMPKEQG